MTSEFRLVARENPALAKRLAESAAIVAASGLNSADVSGWLAARARDHQFRVERIPFDDLKSWSFDPTTGNLAHRSGRFFTVEGLRVAVRDQRLGPVREWQQPIIVQQEIGILGILAKRIDGVLYFLMQAKMEPGNPNKVQLSPTMQATHSNYTRVHGGSSVRYHDYFLRPGRGAVITDVLQSEHGSWFLQKFNRNMIVEVFDDVPPHEDFCWLTLGQIGELLRQDNVVNMDARTVLACAPTIHPEPVALHSDTSLLSWFAAERSRHELSSRRMPLREVQRWQRDEYTIHHEEQKYFRVVAVSVEADSREVADWSQPLFEPVRPGVAAFLVRRFAGVPHLLVHARVEGGFRDTIELGPTVQCTPEYYDGSAGAPRPLFLDLVLNVEEQHVRYAAKQSEEGGRFLNAVNDYLIIDTEGIEMPIQPPPGYFWVTPAQLSTLLRHGHYVNMQARSLLAVINTRAVML